MNTLEVTLFVGAGMFLFGGALGMGLTRTALGDVSNALLGVSKWVAISGLAVSGVSTVLLAYEAYTAGPPHLPNVRGVGAPEIEVTITAAELPELEAVTGEADTSSTALRVQLVGGGDNVTWARLNESGGMLLLEVVGLDNVLDPVGTWTVCVGIPLDGISLAGPSPPWRQYERTHIHPPNTDRNACAYQTYVHKFRLHERPDGPVTLRPLRIVPRDFGVHRIGLGVAPGTEHQGRDEFLRHKSTLQVDCSR